ncbi:hypothetical protein IAT38_001998 [Cryptococcus sp. DSM 104549]
MAPLFSDEESAVDPYKILELESDAVEKDIQRAFRKKSLKYHPDKNPTPEAAVIYRQLNVAVGILSDPIKRNHLDTKLDLERRKRARYAEYDKKRKDMVDSLVAREEEAKRAKVEQVKRRQQEADEESVKDAGRRLLEERQKAALAAQAAVSKPAPAPAPPPSDSLHGSAQPIITPEELTLVLTLPATSPLTSDDLQKSLVAQYGPVAHVLLAEPSAATAAPAEGKKKKAKGRKAVVEFAKGNWGGCWACCRDHEGGKGLEGTKVKWAVGDVPSWVAWAEAQRPGRPSPLHTNGVSSHPTSESLPFSFPVSSDGNDAGAAAGQPSFTSAPDFGGVTMADLLAQHSKSRSAKDAEKQRRDEYESTTLSRMRMMEKARLEEQIRREEEE